MEDREGNNLKNSITERINITDIHGESYEVGIINKQNKIEKTHITFDKTKKLIIIKTHMGIEIKINYDDVIGFIKEEAYKLQKPLDEIVDTSDRKNNRIFNLNYFPSFTYKNCNFCGIFICKPTNNIKKRALKNIKLLISINSIKSIIQEFDSIFNYIIMESNKDNHLKSSDDIIDVIKDPNSKINDLEIDNLNLMEELNIRLSAPIDKIIKPRRRMLVFLNPFGGSGTALKIWNSVFLILEYANIIIEVFETKYYKHAYEHTKVIEAGKYDGILCCSGDGIVHEVINAIFSRSDAELFIKHTAIGVIPGGSANGYAKSICEQSKAVFNEQTCAYLIAKGETKMFDVMEIESASTPNKIYSFLSITWGIIADIDLESEKFRCCGSMRFTLYGVYLLACQRNYFGTLFYAPQENIDENFKFPSLNEELNPKYFTRESKSFSYFYACLVPWVADFAKVAPRSLPDDGFCDIISMDRSTNGKCNLGKLLINQDNGDYFDSKGNIRNGSGVDYKKVKSWRLIPKTQLNESDEVGINRNLPRFYSIDGERYKIEPIQVNILNKSLRVFCFNK